MMIFGFSSQTGPQSGRLSTSIYRLLASVMTLPVSEAVGTLLIRKAAHMFEFALLTASLVYGLYKNGHRYVLIKALIICIIFASLDEYHQTFVSARTGVLTDVLIDSAGSVLMLLGIRLKKGDDLS